MRRRVIRPVLRWLQRLAARARFEGSQRYWSSRYGRGETSGAGSYGKLAAFKAEVLNAFVRDHGVRSVIEHGCGDGHQLTLARYPRYLGLDVAPEAIALCRARFGSDPSKEFRLSSEYGGERAELALSLDVVYHLVEDDVFEAYMRRVFSSAGRFVIVYSSDHDEPAFMAALHVRHRRFTRWVEEQEPGWRLAAHVPNRHPLRLDPEGSFADFFVFERRADPGGAARGGGAGDRSRPAPGR